MNHDKLISSIDATIMSVYDVLYQEYQNITKAKKETYKLTATVLNKFGAVSDLSETIQKLLDEYEKTKDPKIKLKLNHLNDTIKIIEEVRGEKYGGN